MRPDFAAVRAGQKTYAEALDALDHAGLVALTNEYFDEIENIIAGLADADAVAVPFDPALEDQQAGNGAWTIGHIAVHLTASCEETASIGAAMARGVTLPAGTRMRFETPWETITTAGQVTARLAESRRICLAFLAAWPDTPHLDLTVTFIPSFGPINAVGLAAIGLLHADSHLPQIREIMRQLRDGERAKV